MTVITILLLLINDSKASDGYLVGKSGGRPTKPASAYLEAVPNCIVYAERGNSTKERWYSFK